MPVMTFNESDPSHMVEIIGIRNIWCIPWTNTYLAMN